MAAKLSKAEAQLTREVKDLTKAVTKLKNLEFVQILKNPWKMMWLAFLKGMAVGFGSILGATVIVALVIYLLSQISFVPFIGDFVQDIIQEIKQ